MTGLSLGLILLSSLAHATWNFLLKRSVDKEVFVWWLLVAATVLLAPLGGVLLWLYPIQSPGWWLVLGTIVTHFLFKVVEKGFAIFSSSHIDKIDYNNAAHVAKS